MMVRQGIAELSGPSVSVQLTWKGFAVIVLYWNSTQQNVRAKLAPCRLHRSGESPTKDPQP